MAIWIKISMGSSVFIVFSPRVIFFICSHASLSWFNFIFLCDSKFWYSLYFSDFLPLVSIGNSEFWFHSLKWHCCFSRCLIKSLLCLSLSPLALQLLCLWSLTGRFPCSTHSFILSLIHITSDVSHPSGFPVSPLCWALYLCPKLYFIVFLLLLSQEMGSYLKSSLPPG